MDWLGHMEWTGHNLHGRKWGTVLTACAAAGSCYESSGPTLLRAHCLDSQSGVAEHVHRYYDCACLGETVVLILRYSPSSFLLRTLHHKENGFCISASRSAIEIREQKTFSLPTWPPISQTSCDGR